MRTPAEIAAEIAALKAVAAKHHAKDARGPYAQINTLIHKYSKPRIAQIYGGNDDIHGAALEAYDWLDGHTKSLAETWVPKPKEPVQKKWPFK